MSRFSLPDVTLIGIDCVDIDRLVVAAEISQKDINFGAVKLLTSLPGKSHSNIINIDPIQSIQEYSHFCLSQLDDYIDTSHALLIQYDGFILNPHAWTDAFLQYDYIGAPWLVVDWSVRDFDFPPEWLGQLVVGNGGFSLRSKKLTRLCKEMMDTNIFTRYHPEDIAMGVYHRAYLEDHGIKFAPIPLATQFSFEDKIPGCDKWSGQFGFHGLGYTDISNWTTTHPEHNIINHGALKNRLAFQEVTPEQKAKMRRDLRFIDAITKTAKEMRCRIVITGGYAIDAAFGHTTRYHNDIDIQIYGQNENGLVVVQNLLHNIAKQNTEFTDFDIEDKATTDYYRNIYVKTSTVIADIYYLQTVHNPFDEQKVIMRHDGTASDSHLFETHQIHFKGASFEAQLPLLEAVDKIYKREHIGDPKRDKDVQDIQNLKLIISEEEITKKLASKTDLLST